MKKFLTQGRLAALIVFAVLLIDQVIKIWIKTHMYLHENIHVTDWFYIYFTENNGMAFGMEVLPKLFLTLFRIVAVVLITWYLHKITTQKTKLKTGYVVCLAFILAGAIGNIIDCVCYGEIFSESTHYQIASWSGLCRLASRQGSGYVLFPHYRYILAGMDAFLWRGTFHFLQSYLQFCRCFHQLRHYLLANILQ